MLLFLLRVSIKRFKMLKKIILFSLLTFVVMFITIPCVFCAPRKVIGLFLQRNADDMFFKNTVAMMKIAANQLGMEVRPYYANGDQFLMQKQLRNALTGPHKVDAIAITNYKQNGPLFIKMANNAKIPIIIITTNLSPEDKIKLKQSGVNYKYWIGEILPDDLGTGYLMSKYLIRASKPAKDGKIHMIALEGLHSETSSVQRVLGLNKFLRENPNVVLDRLVSTKWSVDIAETKFIELKRFYPQTTAIWSASDGIGLGVVKGAKTLNLKPGKDIYTTGVDWTKEGLDNVQSGNFIVSFGGQYMDGAWASVVFYDYFHGIKLKTNGGSNFSSKMAPLTSSNIATYRRKMSQDNWKNINFREFSKKLNPAIKEYNFSPYVVLKQFK